MTNSVITVTTPVLLNVNEDEPLIISESQLLENSSSYEGVILNVKNLSSSSGELVKNSDETWTLMPNSGFSGSVQLNYEISDGQDSIAVSAFVRGTGNDYLYGGAADDALRGYDADWFRDALREKGTKLCIPAKKNRKTKIKFNGKLYKQRHKVENMFGKFKDWRRVATRYDRCAHTFFSTICIAASVIFYLNQ